MDVHIGLRLPVQSPGRHTHPEHPGASRDTGWMPGEVGFFPGGRKNLGWQSRFERPGGARSHGAKCRIFDFRRRPTISVKQPPPRTGHCREPDTPIDARNRRTARPAPAGPKHSVFATMSRNRSSIPRNGPVIPRNGPFIPWNGPLIPGDGPLVPGNGRVIPGNG